MFMPGQSSASALGGAVVVIMLCVFLFLAGLRMDSDTQSAKARAATGFTDLTPMHRPRSLTALQFENVQLKGRINATVQKSELLRAKLRTSASKLTRRSGVVVSANVASPPAWMQQTAAAAAAELPPTTARRLSATTDFTKERAHAVAGPNKQIILTFVNKIRFDFATSWVAHVQALGLTNWLVGATDSRALKELIRTGVPCFDMRTNLPEGEWPWGSPSFKALGPHKIELIYKAISWDLEVIITDIDAFVLREPFAFMSKRWPDAGFLTTSDHLGNTTADDGLEDHRGIHTAFNIGYMFFRKSALPLVEEWRAVIKSDPRNKWDQGEFNRLARFQWRPHRKDGLSDPRLFWSYKNQVIGGVLPLALFCGGHNYFVSQFAQRKGWQPYSIHTTYQYAAAAGKRHRLREARVWHDPPAYYDPPGGVLSMTLDVPAEMISPPGGMTVQGHIALIKLQLRQVRSALALAFSLNRKLVLPPVTCGYDKYWGPLWRGVIPGTHTWALPIRNCPLDHFLEVGMLDPVNTVREWSFLDNPRMPAAAKTSTAQVTLTKGGAASDFARLEAMASTKVLHLTNSLVGLDMAAASSAVLSSAQKRAFSRKFGYVAGSWCCAPNEEGKRGAPRSAHFSLLRS